MLSKLSTTDKHAHISINEGLTGQGDKALNALLSEFGQIGGSDTFDSKMVRKLTHDDKKRSLEFGYHDK